MRTISIRLIKIMFIMIMGVCVFSIASNVKAAIYFNRSEITIAVDEERTLEVKDGNYLVSVRCSQDGTGEVKIKTDDGKVTITGEEAGEVTITARALKDSSKVAKCKVNVVGELSDEEKEVEASAISLNKRSITMHKNKEFELIAYNDKGKAMNDWDIEWKSSNTSVATVSYGDVESKNFGTATITATCKETGAKATCVVTVEKVNAEVEDEEVQDTTPTVTTTPTQQNKTEEKNDQNIQQQNTNEINEIQETTQTNNETNQENDINEEKQEENISEEISDVTNSITDMDFSLNGIIATIFKIINHIIGYIMENVINGSLNKMLN